MMEANECWNLVRKANNIQELISIISNELNVCNQIKPPCCTNTSKVRLITVPQLAPLSSLVANGQLS